MKSFATMIKYALVAALVFTSADTALAQTPKKRVLLEDATGAWCGYCPRGATTLEKIVEKYPDQVIGVAMHNGSANAPDAMRLPNEPDFSGAYVNGYPNGVVDRKFYTGKSGAKSGMSDNQWESAVAAQISLGSTADVSLKNVQYNAGTRQLTFDVASTFTSAMSGDHRFNAYVVEDSVVGTGSGYDQANYMNTDASSPWFGKGNPIKGFVHRHVIRAVMDGMFGVSGSLPSSIAANTPYSKSYSITIPADWNDNKLSVVGFVMKFTTDAKQHSVLNAIDAKVTGTPQTTGFTVSGETFAVKSTTVGSELPLEVRNLTNAAITYEYTMTKSPRTPADWTGALSETGEFTVAAGATKNLTLTLTPGATIGIGDVTVAIKEKGNPLTGIFKATATVLSKEVQKLNVTFAGEEAGSLGAALVAGGRTEYSEITSDDFLKAAAELSNVKYIVWTGGQTGLMDDETAGAISMMMSTGVNVLISGPATLASLSQAGHQLISELGISRVIDIQLATFGAIGYKDDPISNGFTGTVTLLAGGFYAQEYRIEDDMIAKPILRLQTANRIVGTRSQTETARAVNLAFNPLAITDATKRNAFMDKVMDWLETAATPTAKLELSSPLLDFEEVKTTETKEITVDITSNGTAPLVITGLTITGAQAANFTLVNAPTFPLTLNAGETTTVTVKFAPNAGGDFLASLNVLSNVEGDNSVILAGIGAVVGSVDDFTAGSLEFLKVNVSPNPAMDKAVVSYTVAGLLPQTVELSVVDALGNTVQSFGSRTLAPGAHTQDINAATLASGSYRLVARSNETAVQVPFVIAR